MRDTFSGSVDLENERSRSEVRPRGRLRFRLRIFVPLILFLGLVVHLLLPQIPALDQSLHVFRSMSIGLILLALIAQAVSYCANGALLRGIVATSGDHVSLKRSTAIVMAASTVCLVAGGIVGYGAAVYEWTRRSGTSRHSAAIAAWLPSVFDGAALVIVAFAGAIELLLWHRLPRPAIVALLIVASLLIAVICLSFYALSRSDRFEALLRRVPIVRRRLGETSDDVHERLSILSDALRRRRGVEAVSFALLNLIFDMTTLALVFIAAGHAVSPFVLIAGYGVPLLLGRFSFLPGGIAVIEVGMSALYTALGVPAAIAVAAILTYRFISFWLPTMFGIPVAVVLQARRSHRTRGV